METHKLTHEQEYFCELYVHGDAPYAGNPAMCYCEAFNVSKEKKNTRALANYLLRQENIKKYIEELETLVDSKAKEIKRFLTENLTHIVEECATAVYQDRRGTKLSPAPLRSVAVAAAKALMDMYPIKETQKHELNIDGGGEAGITFNIVVPESTKETHKMEE